MLSYILRRMLLIIPTLLGILTVNFFIVQAAPGGPVEQTIARLRHSEMDATSRVSGMGNSDLGMKSNALVNENATTAYRGAQGIDPKLIADLEKMYGFDKPLYERYFLMLNNYLHFDLGKSFYHDQPVLGLILSKLPVSISIGLWSTLLIYLISIPLGIAKAVRDGTWFDAWTTVIIVIGYAIPSFLFALMLILLFSGGSYWHVFPLRGLTSDDWDTFSTFHKITDYFWHMTLPVVAMVIGGFASLTMLTKNSFLDEINKQYVMTARAKGLGERAVLIKHVFRNAMLIVIAGFPKAFISILFTSSLLIEIIFSLDGLGLLSYEAAIGRDYAVMFGSLYFFSLIGLLLNLIGDITYVLIDPRIDFSTRMA